MFSRNIDPPVVSAVNPEVMTNSIVRGERETAAYAAGWGTAFITLGSLTLAVPWVNSALKLQTAAPENNSNEAAR